MKGLIVTGTDTGVGKTFVAAALCRAFDRHGTDVRYWKPVQTGTDDDGATVRRLSGLAAERVVAPALSLSLPASPLEAAAHEGRCLTAAERRPALPRVPTRAHLVVEGAGGLLVPIGERFMMVDLFAHLGLPLLLVTRPELGTINHTLLSIEAIRRRGLRLSMVLFAGRPSATVRAVIARRARCFAIARLPRRAASFRRAVDREMRAELGDVVARLEGGPS